jgi:hypothetical protein
MGVIVGSMGWADHFGLWKIKVEFMMVALRRNFMEMSLRMESYDISKELVSES